MLAEKNAIDKYEMIYDRRTPRKNIFISSLKAFVFGGILCIIGEVLKKLFISAGMAEDMAVTGYLVVIIVVAALFTGLGVYDKAGQFLGAGLSVPISGFANSVSSAMIEYRSEGMVPGLASNAFKLAGCVIICGSISAFLLAFIDYLTGVLL